MVSKVFDFNQRNSIEGSAALSRYQDGVCLAFSMKWVQNKRNLGQEYLTLVNDESQKKVLADWMKKCQGDVLEKLSGR